jgi:hypothetical protein
MAHERLHRRALQPTAAALHPLLPPPPLPTLPQTTTTMTKPPTPPTNEVGGGDCKQEGSYTYTDTGKETKTGKKLGRS